MSRTNKRFLSRIWELITGVSLRIKVLGIALMMIVLLGIVLTWQMRVAMSQALGEELEQRGISVANRLADRSLDQMMAGTVQDLYELMHETVADNQDVRYAFVLDNQGNLLAHSFDEDFFDLLPEDTHIPLFRSYRTAIFTGEEELVQDTGVPLFGGVGTAHVGISHTRVDRVLSEVTRQFVLITVVASLLGVLISMALTWLFTRPLLDLADAAKLLPHGELRHHISPWANDEIGQLQASFSDMAEELTLSRREMEEYNRRLLRRNRELAALYDISHIVSGPLRLKEVLESVLDRAANLVGAVGGWICMFRDDNSCQVRVSVWNDFTHPCSDIGECCSCSRCLEAVEKNKAMVVSSGFVECALHVDQGNGSEPADGEMCHVVVPLSVRNRTIGLLNLVCGVEECGEGEELDLLQTVGQQLATVIDKETLQEDLLRRIMAAQEDERGRIARELHDETGQALTSLLVGLRLIEKSKNVQEAHELTSNMRQMVAQAIDEVRNLALELRPSVLDDMGLVPALSNYFQGCPDRLGINVDFVTAGLDDRRLPMEVETALYRIAQEALTNAARHAEANHVSVLLERRNGTLVLIVEDDGKGFDPQEIRSSPDGRKRLGIYGMNERAGLLGGKLTIESSPGQGTTVSVEVPLEAKWLKRERKAEERSSLSVS